MATSSKKQKKVSGSRGIALIIAMIAVCVVAASLFIAYTMVNSTYIRINKEKISRPKYEYFFHVNRIAYGELYSNLMTGMGNGNTETEFSTMTIHTNSGMKDAVDKVTVDGLMRNMALLAAAEAEGFTYDAEAEFSGFEKRIERNAAEAEMSVRKYIQNNYGEYATMKRISKFFKEDIVASAFCDYKEEQFVPTEVQLQEYYEAHKDTLELYDLRMTVIKAEDLKESDNLKNVLKEAEASIWAEGTLYEGVSVRSLNDSIKEWVQDSERKANDSAVVKHTGKEIYYVLGFIEGYPDTSLTADIRILRTSKTESKELLEWWKAGVATEESFAELCMAYSEDATAANGGMMEGVTQNTFYIDVASWIFDENRAPGDTTALESADGYDYMLYYIKQNDCAWKMEARNEIVSEKVLAYLEEITAGMEVKDPKNNLKYDE